MEPESNHVSNTSGMRFIVPPHWHCTVISSTMCLWRLSIFLPLASSSAATLPKMRFVLHFSHIHTGITLAQKRWREIDQSRAPSSHLPQRPSLMCLGDQLMAFAFLSRLSFIFVTETNHELVA